MDTDSHLHFDDFYAEGLTEALLARAREAGVTRMVAIGGRDTANALTLRLATEYPGFVYATAGYDRDVASGWDGDCSRLDPLLADDRVVAVGECGLDYHYNYGEPADQRILFGCMLERAAAHAKPVVVHSREAEDDTLAMLKEYRQAWPYADRSPGVVHCFTGSRSFAENLVELNFHIGFTGILTFRTAEDLRQTAAALPMAHLLIETDSPYLAPVPHRGKRNEPAFVPRVADCLAECRGVAVEEIARVTSANAERLFGLA